MDSFEMAYGLDGEGAQDSSARRPLGDLAVDRAAGARVKTTFSTLCLDRGVEQIDAPHHVHLGVEMRFADADGDAGLRGSMAHCSG